MKIRNEWYWLRACLGLLAVNILASAAFCVTAPAIVPHPYDHDGSYTLSWSAATDVSGIASYELQEATTTEVATSLFSDNAESGLVSWDAVGFTATATTAAHSPTHSIYSGQANNLNNSLILKNPITAESDTVLSFWTKYTTESYYDYLRVQVSTDKTNWTTLEAICGAQSTFVKKNYSLSSYAGQAIYVRFIYTTDSSICYEGVYLDDISISNNSGYNFSVVSGALTATSYSFSGKSNGRYYYRVRAKNTSGTWGQFSETATVEVGPDVYPPDAPAIAGPTAIVCGANLDLAWNTPTDESGIAAYELQESIGSTGSLSIDDAEGGLSKWNSSGFSVSSTDHLGGSRSFFTGSGNDLYQTMTLVSPVAVASGDRLKFWCNYSLETGYDYLAVYVSTNGTSWVCLDSVSGNSGGWIRKDYSLNNYAGQSVYLKFVYLTDSSVVSAGAYLDDMVLDHTNGTAADWTSLAAALTSNSYRIARNDPGRYYYRVRAKDAAGNWSAFSQSATVLVAVSAGIDFAVTREGIAFSPAKISEGETLSARLVISNCGTQSAYANVAVYCNSKDPAHSVGNSSYNLVPALDSTEIDFSFNTRGMGKNPTLFFVVSPTYGSDVDTVPGNNEVAQQANIISFVRPTLCYPNPFDPTSQTTKIAYRLDQAEWTQIVIFDAAGRIVWRRTFTPGSPGGESGLNEVEWTGVTDYGETARNGLYIYKVIDALTKKPFFSGKVVVLK